MFERGRGRRGIERQPSKGKGRMKESAKDNKREINMKREEERGIERDREGW